MARDFSARTDIDKTEPAKYPDGRIKDGITDGTKAGEEVVGDFYQVFLKAMRDAGITPNGLPDNETNGWQMFDAMKIAFAGDSGWVEVTDLADGNTTGDDAGYGKLRCRRLNGMVYITGSYIQGTGNNGFTLPLGYRPIKPLFNKLPSSDGSGFIVNDIGRVYFAGGISAGTYSFNCSFPIDPTV